MEVTTSIAKSFLVILANHKEITEGLSPFWLATRNKVNFLPPIRRAKTRFIFLIRKRLTQSWARNSLLPNPLSIILLKDSSGTWIARSPNNNKTVTQTPSTCQMTPRDTTSVVDILSRVFLVPDSWNRSTKIGAVQNLTVMPRHKTFPRIWRKTGWKLPWNRTGRKKKTFTKASQLIRSLNLSRNMSLWRISAGRIMIISL